MSRLPKRGKLKISTKVALSFVIIVVFQGAMTQIGMSVLISRSSVDAFRTQLQTTMHGIDASLARSSADLNNKVTLLAGQKNVIEYTDFRLRNLLRRELSLFNDPLGLDGIFVFIDGGRLLATDGEAVTLSDSLLTRIEDAAGRETTSFLDDDGSTPYLWNFAPIIREDGVIGMVGARLAIDAGFVGELEQGSAAFILVHFPKHTIHTDSLDSARWETLAASAATASQGEIRPAGDYLLGVQSLAGLGDPGTQLLTVLDMRESRRDIANYNGFAVLLTVVVLSFASVLSILFYRQSFLRPYLALQEGVARIGNGDFSYPIEQTTADEFGDLVRSVNQMRVNLLNRDRALTALANYNELILNNVRSGIITVGHDARITAWNAAARNMVHLDGERTPPIDLGEAGLPEEVVDIIRRGIAGGDYVTLRECRLNYGARDEILTVSTNPFADGSGEELGVIAVIADVTQVRKLEEQLQVSKRLAAIGEMVAGVAHQLRNPMAIMKVSAEMLRDNYGNGVPTDSAQYAELTSMLVSEIDTLNYIVDNFLNFARPLHVNRSACTLKEIIGTAISLVPMDKYPGLSIETEYQEGLPDVRVDKDLMEQVVRNLVLNALEASEEGAVRISAETQGNEVRVRVRDWGCGMDSDTQANVFNPFFTQKNKGTGLGLSIVHRIVQEHGGRIEVESSPGEGSLFTVVLGSEEVRA